MEEVKCPYCREYVEINVDDHYEGTEECECPKCEKFFEVFAEAYISYSVSDKADCLNGGEHKWRQQIGSPDIHFKGKYLCNDCTATKTVESEIATKEEWDIYFGR